MHPFIFGFIDSYALFMAIGIIVALLILFFYIKKIGYKRNGIIDVLLLAIASIASGVIFAILFQNLYELIEKKSAYTWTWGMTFYGGLVGGAGVFFLLYFLWYKKAHEPLIKDILVVAPLCISSAHFFGRIGCFLAGCCYGKESSSWLATTFSGNMTPSRVPTQLIEASFLLILSIVLALFVFKRNKLSIVVYMLSYGIFRFIIEFYRGDERGQFIGKISPSQFWCIILVLGGIALLVLMILERKKKCDSSLETH
ncbi:MAG: prolipoprotein diacylglyceryl transferase [Bacilli bacterium]|nr:prolipoprotein diacylglyceryl transferase [Bacilli bacterium]